MRISNYGYDGGQKCYRKSQGTEKNWVLDYLHEPGNVQKERC